MDMVTSTTTIPLRDGVKLSALAFRPATGAAATLLVRTPYGVQAFPGMLGNGGLIPNVLVFLEAGYAVVMVECRGTFGSQGRFRPVVDEPHDGFDTVEWIVAQPWSDGRVGTYGMSYFGMTQWALATTSHPAVRALVPTMTALDWYKGVWYGPGGALSAAITVPWAATTQLTTALREPTPETAQRAGELFSLVASGLAVTEEQPILAQPTLTDRWFHDLLEHPSYDGFWQDQTLTSRVEGIHAPSLMITGWYDIFINQQLRDFELVRGRAGSPAARTGTRLVVGPWDHYDLGLNARTPDRDFGFAATGATADVTGLHLRHFARWLPASGETPADLQDEPPVRLFVMGLDQWRDESDWPLPDTAYEDWYLDEGTLGTTPPERETSASYRYDPTDPVRTTTSWRPGDAWTPTALHHEDRRDVLTFITDVLDEPLKVTGYVTAHLSVGSDTLDTDVTAELLDVFPDGRAVRLCHGILRLRYRDGLSQPRPLVPGERYDVVVDLAATSNCFLPGHRVRLDVSSSNFPRYDRNTNTGGEINLESAADGVVAHTTVFCGGERASRLVLPRIRR